jgi:hypothetical protein
MTSEMGLRTLDELALRGDAAGELEIDGAAVSFQGVVLPDKIGWEGLKELVLEMLYGNMDGHTGMKLTLTLHAELVPGPDGPAVTLSAPSVEQAEFEGQAVEPVWGLKVL